MLSNYRKIIARATSTLLVMCVSYSASGQTLLFSDDFESGNLNHTQNGVSWTTAKGTSVSTWQAKSGNNALLFDAGFRNSAEQRFALGKGYSELTIEFDMYIPDGKGPYGGMIYDHYNAEGSSSNNKFLRLWDSNGYSGNQEKVGFSTGFGSGGGISSHFAEWNPGRGMGAQGSDSRENAFIVASDRGNWINVKSYLKHSSSNNDDGIIRFYKNGVLLYERTDMDNYYSGGDHAWSVGYVLGSMNGDPPEGDRLYILVDNVKIWAGASTTSPPNQSASTTNPPNPPTLVTNTK